MDQDHWRIVNRIFHAALEVEQSQRRDLILDQAEGDTGVQLEVEQLLRADAEASTYLEHPITLSGVWLPPDSAVEVGQLLCDRFRIDREIAEGGMGRVFEAFDQELSVRIALKVIRPELAASREVLARFRHEVRLARSITHPNICRTFDLERASLHDGDIIFLTMEFLDGETLASRLKREGALPLDTSLAIAQQIAVALEAAHGLGIVHRDIKPANIMLVPDLSQCTSMRAVVTDFGLARLDPLAMDRAAMADGQTAFSHVGRPIGTLGYMSPEQLGGEAVSPATDVYALALVLYEMATGERLFDSGHLLSSIAQRLKSDRLSLDRPGAHRLPTSWRRAIQAGLNHDPGGRPPSPSVLLEMAEGQRALPAMPGSSRGILSARALSAAVLALFVMVSLFYAGYRFTSSRADSKIAPGALVYLAGVRNLTGEKSLDATAELLRASLAQSTQLNLLDQGKVGDTLQQMKKNPETIPDGPTGREIAMRTGAVRAVFATISGKDGNYRLDVDVQQPDNTPVRYRHHWTHSFSWQSAATANGSSTIPAELLTSVRDASGWIRNQVGESAHDIATLDTPPEEVTTANWNALTEFTAAQKLVDKNKLDDAVAAYRRAIALDPSFSLAYAHMADVLVGMSRRAEGYAAYLTALNSDTGQRLSRKERDFIQGSFAADTQDYVTAVNAFRDYSAFYPNDVNAWSYQAIPLLMLNRTDEAMQAALRADALSPRYGGAIHLAYGAMLQADRVETANRIAVFRQTGREEIAVLLEAMAAFLEGRYAASKQAFERLQRSKSRGFQLYGFAGLARLHAEQADYREAQQSLAQDNLHLSSADAALRRSAFALDRAWLDGRLADYTGCLSEVDAALSLDASPDTVLRSSNTLGTFLPAMQPDIAGKAIASLRRMARLLPLSPSVTIVELARENVLGEIDLATGHASGALSHLRKADAIAAPARPRGSLPRALLAAAASERNPAVARQLQEEALSVYGHVALRPAVVWINPWVYPPGFAADQMSSYLALSRQLHRNDADGDTVAATLTGLRKAPPKHQPATHKP